MAHHFEVDAGRKILLGVLEGEVDNHELQQIYDELKRLAGNLVVSAGVMDFSGVTRLAVDSSTVHWLADAKPSFPEEMPRFLIAPKDEIYGISRMYELIADRPALEVVRTREAAFAALGLTDPRFETLPSI